MIAQHLKIETEEQILSVVGQETLLSPNGAKSEMIHPSQLNKNEKFLFEYLPLTSLFEEKKEDSMKP
jgi:hypothetical protein